MISSFKSRRLRSLTLALFVATAGLPGCSSQPKTPRESWEDLRKDAARSDKAADVSEWLLAELLRPGGSAEQAKKARARLDKLGAQGPLSHLARGLDDVGHGRSKEAADDFFLALMHSRKWDDERAPMFAWFAAKRVDQLSSLNPNFGAEHRDDIETLLKDPGNIGFRAYTTVVELWAQDAFSEAKQDVDTMLASKLGCVSEVTLAGPFGQNPGTDLLRSFSAENPGVWPERFELSPGRVSPPKRLSTTQIGCDILADEPTAAGVFYGQTFLEVDKTTEVILSASGATHIYVNDALVLHRDIRTWGVWPKFGARVELTPGRHRVVWKFSDPSTALRVVTLDGRAASVKATRDDRLGYTLVPPKVGADPNALMRYIKPNAVVDPGDDLTRYVAAYLAEIEGQADVATVLFEPLVKDVDQATGLALSTAAGFVENDPIYEEAQTRDLVHELEVRAAKRDTGLWYPRFRNLIWEAEQKGPTTVVKDLEKLAKRFPEVSAIRFTLAQLYENLEWGPEHESTVKDLVARYPNDTDAIVLGIDYYATEGDTKKVDSLLESLSKLDPDNEVFFARALAAENYEAALAELRRLEARRPSRKDIASRIDRILVQAGDKKQTFESLKQAVAREPRDIHARLALADARLAQGEKNPLPKALVEAVEAGADPGIIEGAIDLLEGLTALEPYRLDGKQVIREYEAKGAHLPGTAARVLDYGAVWVRGDGSSRFLEHEIVRIQSEEAIKRFTETDTQGLILHMRVIKKDGSILEPEAVAGKPTVTMPHLEVGDYIETERIISRWGDGVGQRYLGPGWFFRELNVAYSRTEFVVIAPAEKALIMEPHNGVPDPEITRTDSLVIYRYRVDDSPAAPVEPNSPPEQEFLPRVNIGWGLSFEDRIENLNRDMVSVTANDPRIVRIAENIVAEEKDDAAKLRALYHWVLDSVQEGEETDGRRVVVSRNGNRWRGFQTLCRALGLDVKWVLAESRLSSPEDGPLASAERGLYPLLAVGSGEARTFLTIDDQFAPFGTIPSHLRGEPAYVLGGEEPEVTVVPETGPEDAIEYEGTGVLSADGSAVLDLRIVFLGTFATSLRNGLSQIPENQLGNIIESRLLGQYLQGARLQSYKVLHQDDLEHPLVIAVQTEVPQFATPSSGGMLLSPPFMPHLTGLTPLAERATPLLIRQESRQSLDLKLTLPEGVSAEVAKANGKMDLSAYEVSDTAHAGSLHLLRDVGSRAGRVPVTEYAAFQKYASEADAALTRAVRLKR